MLDLWPDFYIVMGGFALIVLVAVFVFDRAPKPRNGSRRPHASRHA